MARIKLRTGCSSSAKRIVRPLPVGDIMLHPSRRFHVGRSVSGAQKTPVPLNSVGGKARLIVARPVHRAVVIFNACRATPNGSGNPEWTQSIAIGRAKHLS